MLFSIECQCEGSPLSPGQPGCVPIVGRDKFPIFFEYTDSTGALNGVPAGTVLDETFLVDKLNETDQTKRWYVFPEMFNIASPPSENETEDIDGVPVPTGEEIRQVSTFEHVKKDANPAIKAAYDSLKCEDLGVIFGTYSGQLNGMNDGNGNLVGIHIKSGTLSAQYSAPVKGAVQKMMVSYIVDDLENDANRDFISSANIAYPIKNWFTNQPLEVIPFEVSNAAATTIVFRLNSLYGQVDFKSPVEGILTADISPDLGVTTGEVYNETTALNVAATLVESSTDPGLYTLTLGVAQTAADIIAIDIFKSGYNMSTFRVTLD